MATNDGWETISPAATPAKADDGWETVTPAKGGSSGEPAPTVNKPSMGAAFAAGTASALDFPLSAPGFVLSTATELASDTMGMIASPFTGKSAKQVYQEGAQSGQVMGEALMNPLQKIMNLFGEADAYAQAPLPQAMSWFGEKLQAGGKKLEAATGIPAESVPLMANVGMITGTGGVGKAALAKGKEMLTGASKNKGRATPSDLPEKPPETATQSEKDAYKEHLLKRREAVKESQPLVETAIRNKEDGTIEKMGPKHDEARKAETKDTHEQGFMDKEGNFLTREEAYQRALKTGMLDKTHALEFPDEGLHSGDLRATGHKDFQLTDEQKAGVPKEAKAPVTREEHKTTVVDIEQQLHSLQSKLNLAENPYAPNEAEASRIHGEMKVLQKQSADLRAAMPEVQIADKLKPTWEETHDITWGAKNVGEAMDALAKADIGGTGQKVLLKALSKMRLIRDASFSTSLERLDWTDAYGKPQTGALGLYDRKTHSVTVGKDGDLQTHLHEYIHAGTSKAVAEGNMAVVKALNKIHEKFQARRDAEYAVLLTEYQATGPKTMKELNEFKKQNKIDALYDLHEMLSDAFTDKRTVKWMKETPSDSTRPLSKLNRVWNDFKNAVHTAIGTPSEARSALDDVLEQGVELLQRAEGQYRKDGITSAASDAVHPSKESYTSKPTTAPTTAEDAAKEGGAITEKLRTEPIETPETPNYKEVKSWNDLVAHGERVLFAEGEEAAMKFFDDFKDFKKTWGEHQAGVDKLVHENIQGKAADERLSVLSNKELEKAITNPAENDAVRRAIENGKVDTLPQKLKDAANRFKSDLKSYWERANKEGVINGYIENYFPHMLDWVGGPEGVDGPKPEPGAMKALIKEIVGKGDGEGSTNMFGMDTGTKRDLKRSMETIEDLNAFVTKLNAAIERSYIKRLGNFREQKAALEKEGKYTGHLEEPTKPFNLQIKTDSIVEAHSIYTHSISKAIANKKLVEGLKDLRDQQGNPVLRPIEDNKMPFGWKQIDSPQLSGMAIHPDLEPSLKFLYDAGPSQWMKAALAVSQAVKRFNVIGSFFHAKSLLEVLNSAKTPLWSPLYHGIIAPLAEQGAKAFGKEVRLSAISKAVEAYRKAELGDSVDRWIREDGLNIEVPEDVTQGVLTSIGKASDELIGKYGPKTRALEKTLYTVEKYTLGMFDKYTWDYLHTGIKLHVAESYLAKQKEAAAKSGAPFDEAKARGEIASFVNNAAGGLNWFKAATEAKTEFGRRMAMSAYSPAGRRALQVTLFAPDWTLSTLRAFTSALPEKMNPTQWHPVEGIKGMLAPTTKADYARLYQFKTALMYFTMLNGINMMTANRPIWENKDPTRIEWPDGTSMQAMKHAMEPYHWLMDPDKTFANKLGFVPKAMIVGFGGVEYASPNAPKLIDSSGPGRLKAVASMALPFQAAAAKNAPEGEATKRAVLGTLGFPEYGSTAAQKKAARAEREKALKKAAKEYHIKAKEKGWE